jgi:hypothetical protein
VAQKHIRRLQTLHDVIQQLLQGGLTGTDLLRTLVNRYIQPLRWQEITMWMYPGSSCPDGPFSTELDDMEVNTQI